MIRESILEAISRTSDIDLPQNSLERLTFVYRGTISTISRMLDMNNSRGLQEGSILVLARDIGEIIKGINRYRRELVEDGHIKTREGILVNLRNARDKLYAAAYIASSPEGRNRKAFYDNLRRCQDYLSEALRHF